MATWSIVSMQRGDRKLAGRARAAHFMVSRMEGGREEEREGRSERMRTRRNGMGTIYIP